MPRLEEPNLPIKPNICCGYPTDAAESFNSIVEEEETRNPRAGDFVVCLNCGTLLVYINEKNDMRFAQARDNALLTPGELKRLKKIRKYIRQRGRIWPRKRSGHRASPN